MIPRRNVWRTKRTVRTPRQTNCLNTKTDSRENQTACLDTQGVTDGYADNIDDQIVSSRASYSIRPKSTKIKNVRIKKHIKDRCYVQNMRNPSKFQNSLKSLILSKVLPSITISLDLVIPPRILKISSKFPKKVNHTLHCFPRMWCKFRCSERRTICFSL